MGDEMRRVKTMWLGSQIRWSTSVIPALGRLTEEDQEFQGNLGYVTLPQNTKKTK
jgi:hypothetical protein